MRSRLLSHPLYTILSVFFLLVFSFRSLALHMTTHLPDWNDYPFIVWTVYQNIGHIRHASFYGFFDTNIFYGYHGSLLFSDLLLPQSIIALPFSLFISNQILVFNILFFLTLLLNVCAVYFFWRQVISEKPKLFFAVFATCISGLLFQNSVYFQFLSFWPFFFGFGFLLKKRKTFTDSVALGFWMAIQFLSGVYLAIFLLTATGVWYLLEIVFSFTKRKALIDLSKELLISLSVFILGAGVCISKYIQIKHLYGITRAYWEYIYYSAHLSDYIFSTNYQSVLSSLWPISRWNSLNHAGSLFPGTVLIVLSFAGVVVYRHIKDRYEISLSLERKSLYFFLLWIGGFFASLGPRLNVNGSYVGIPLPYFLPLKLVPLFEPIRVNGRWYIFVLIALVYFSIQGMKRLSLLSRPAMILLCCLLITLEVMPISRQTEAKMYYHEVYKKIEPICTQSPEVLLEYPMTQDTKDINIVTNLTYRTQAMLASLTHHCLLVNGYMGYAPKDYDRYEQVLTDSVNRNLPDIFWRLLQEKDVRFVKLNKKDLFSEKTATVEALLKKNEHTQILAETSDFLLAEVKP